MKKMTVIEVVRIGIKVREGGSPHLPIKEPLLPLSGLLLLRPPPPLGLGLAHVAPLLLLLLLLLVGPDAGGSPGRPADAGGAVIPPRVAQLSHSFLGLRLVRLAFLHFRGWRFGRFNIRHLDIRCDL